MARRAVVLDRRKVRRLAGKLDRAADTLAGAGGKLAARLLARRLEDDERAKFLREFRRRVPAHVRYFWKAQDHATRTGCSLPSASRALGLDHREVRRGKNGADFFVTRAESDLALFYTYASGEGKTGA